MESEPNTPSSNRRMAQLVIRVVALLLFLLLGYLTVPKLAPRFSGIYQRAAARQSVWRKAAGKQDIPKEEIVRGNDVLVIGVVVAGGALLLAGLGYAALRR